MNLYKTRSETNFDLKVPDKPTFQSQPIVVQSRLVWGMGSSWSGKKVTSHIRIFLKMDLLFGDTKRKPAKRWVDKTLYQLVDCLPQCLNWVLFVPTGLKWIWSIHSEGSFSNFSQALLRAAGRRLCGGPRTPGLASAAAAGARGRGGASRRKGLVGVGCAGFVSRSRELWRLLFLPVPEKATPKRVSLKKDTPGLVGWRFL